MGEETPLEVDVHAFNDLRESGTAHAVLDVREPQEIAICALPESLQIRMMEIPDSLEQIPKDGPLVVLCHSGMRSLQVAQWLRMQGYENAQSLAGGIDAWAQAYDPSMQRY